AFLCPLLTSVAEFRGDSSPPSPFSVTCNRSPEVSSTAFCAQPPNLRLAPLDRYELRDHLPARPALPPQIRFLYIGSCICSTLPSDPASQRRPCASLSLHLYRLVKSTFKFKMSNMLGTQKEGADILVRATCPYGFTTVASAAFRSSGLNPNGPGLLL